MNLGSNPELDSDDMEFDTGDSAPDATALLRDDVLLDALAKGVFPVEYADDAMVNALWDWREDVVNGPVQLDSVPELAIALAEQPSASDSALEERVARRQRRFSLGRRLAISFAAAFVGFGALGSVAAASVAKPGDPMFPLTKVVNSKRANSLEARDHAVDKLNNARTAVKHDNPQVARKHIAGALADAKKVRNKDGKQDLRQQLVALQAELTPPVPTPTPSENPGKPKPSDPSLPSPSPTDPTSPSPSPTKPSPSGSPTPSDSLLPASGTPSSKPRTATPSTSGSAS